MENPKHRFDALAPQRRRKEYKLTRSAESVSLKKYKETVLDEAKQDYQRTVKETEAEAAAATLAARAGMSAAEQGRNVGTNRAAEEAERAAAAKDKKPGPKATFEPFIDGEVFSQTDMFGQN